MERERVPPSDSLCDALDAQRREVVRVFSATHSVAHPFESVFPEEVRMKSLIAPVVICISATLPAVAHPYEQKSFVAASTFDVRLGGEEQSFAAGLVGASERGEWYRHGRMVDGNGWKGAADDDEQDGSDDWHDGSTITAVPEPSTWPLLALGAALLGLARWRAAHRD